LSRTQGFLLAGRPVDLFELVNHPWALPPSNQRWRQQLEEQFFGRGLSPPKPTVVSNSSTFLRGLLRGGDYLSFLPRQLIGEDESLVALDVELTPFEPEISVTYKERSLNEPTVLEVIQVLRGVASELTATPAE
jgi:DNA-binding transcriptional LysR family regulator